MTDRIAELANENSIFELDKIMPDPNPDMRSYETERRTKLLFTAMQDIHYLALGVEELNEQLGVILDALLIIAKQQRIQKDLLDLLVRRENNETR